MCCQQCYWVNKNTIQCTELDLRQGRRETSIPQTQWCILHIPPNFRKYLKFPPISTKFINTPLFSLNLGFLLNLRFLLPHILTMMHLCIMIYTYWTTLTLGAIQTKAVTRLLTKCGNERLLLSLPIGLWLPWLFGRISAPQMALWRKMAPRTSVVVLHPIQLISHLVIGGIDNVAVLIPHVAMAAARVRRWSK